MEAHALNYFLFFLNPKKSLFARSSMLLVHKAYYACALLRNVIKLPMI